MYSGKPRVCWNDKEITRSRSAVDLAQEYLDKKEKKMKGRAFVVYPEHAVLLNVQCGAEMESYLQGTCPGSIPTC